MKKNKKTQPAQMDNSILVMEDKPLHLDNYHAKTKCIMQNRWCGKIMLVIILMLVSDRLTVISHA